MADLINLSFDYYVRGNALPLTLPLIDERIMGMNLAIPFCDLTVILVGRFAVQQTEGSRNE